MVILRPTRKLGELVPQPIEPGTVSDTALGDWYVNRIVVDRQPLLVVISSRSLLPVVVRARAVKTLPDRLPEVVENRLLRLGIVGETVACEVEVMSPVRVARTVDRSVLGSLVDFAKLISYYVPGDGWDDHALHAVEDRLSRTPCRVGRRSKDVIFPRDKTQELLEATWS